MNRAWVLSAALAVLNLALAWSRLASDQPLLAIGFFFVALFAAGQAVGHFRDRNAPPKTERTLNPEAAKVLAVGAGIAAVVALTLGVTLDFELSWWFAALLSAPVALPIVLGMWPQRDAGGNPSQ